MCCSSGEEDVSSVGAAMHLHVRVAETWAERDAADDGRGSWRGRRESGSGRRNDGGSSESDQHWRQQEHMLLLAWKIVGVVCELQAAGRPMEGPKSCSFYTWSNRPTKQSGWKQTTAIDCQPLGLQALLGVVGSVRVSHSAVQCSHRGRRDIQIQAPDTISD